MKKTVPLILALLMVLSMIPTAFAADFVNSSEEPGINIEEDLDDYVITSHGDIIYINPKTSRPDELVINSVEIITNENATVYGNLDEISEAKVKAILTATVKELRSAKSLYELTNWDRRFDREGLQVCAIFDVSYARELSSNNYDKNTYPKKEYGYVISITFHNVQEKIVAVLHGDDNGLNWKPMMFEQRGTDVIVYTFEDFSPVIFIAASDQPGISTDPILPHSGGDGGGSGGGTKVPTSPQTGEMSYAWIPCSCGAAMLTVCAFVRRRSVR